MLSANTAKSMPITVYICFYNAEKPGDRCVYTMKSNPGPVTDNVLVKQVSNMLPKYSRVFMVLYFLVKDTESGFASGPFFQSFM